MGKEHLVRKLARLGKIQQLEELLAKEPSIVYHNPTGYSLKDDALVLHEAIQSRDAQVGRRRRRRRRDGVLNV